VVQLRKADPELDLNSRRSALRLIKDYRAKEQILTGLLYMDEDSQDLHEIIGTSKTPLQALTEAELCPGQKVLDKLNDSLR
jgi:2-oxoglutarate ferredoxin oxidoreductase subunit beta